MIIVGLTGGIGSGKSTIAKVFMDLGVPVYNSDESAKNLMTNDKELIAQILKLFGPQAYINSQLNRAHIANQVFNDNKLLKALNEMVHPAVANDFAKWKDQQNHPYVIQESALIIENNNQDKYDYIILVVADTQERIKRVMKRDHKTRREVMARINQQLSDEHKMNHAHFIVRNDLLKRTQTEVLKIHQELTKIAGIRQGG